MNITTTQKKTLEGLIRFERDIRNLYKLYAEIMPHKRDFWITLANEENEHANWLIALKGQIETGCVTCREDRFNIQGIEKALAFIMRQRILAGKPGFDFMRALSTALDIEKLILEKKFYECYDSDCQEIRKILRDLRNDTENHVNRIEQVWNQYKTMHS